MSLFFYGAQNQGMIREQCRYASVHNTSWRQRWHPCVGSNNDNDGFKPAHFYFNTYHPPFGGTTRNGQEGPVYTQCQGWPFQFLWGKDAPFVLALPLESFTSTKRRLMITSWSIPTNTNTRASASALDVPQPNRWSPVRTTDS